MSDMVPQPIRNYSNSDHNNLNQKYNETATRKAGGRDLKNEKTHVIQEGKCNGLHKSPQIDHFHLFDKTIAFSCPATHLKRPTVATKLIANTLYPNSPTELHPSEKTVFPKLGPWTAPLQAVPLASYYKLHRVPSLNAMTEPRASSAQEEVKLPRKESGAEMPADSLSNGVHSKILDQEVRTPGRQPSPQPIHLSVPGPGSHRILQEHGPGYVAPKFEGKDLQMEQGMVETYFLCLHATLLTESINQ